MTPPAHYPPEFITKNLARGSLYVAAILMIIFASYESPFTPYFHARFWIAFTAFLYLIAVHFILSRGYIKIANWLIILLYEALAACILIHWGLTSVIGILGICFAILLPSILMAPRYIIFVTFMTFGILILTGTLHSTAIVIPTIYIPTPTSSLIDVITYMSILTIFAFIVWTSASKSSSTLRRALEAEEELRSQKHHLTIALEEESTKLRDSQLQQIQQLHRFAVIGQSATATLHELSNHLSILNLDIDDLKQQHKHSKAIANAEDGIRHLNHMVRKARAHLNEQSEAREFNAYPTISRALKDTAHKLTQHHIKLVRSRSTNRRSFRILGDNLHLTQCLTILINNAVDACANVSNAQITIVTAIDEEAMTITISDNGPGIPKDIRRHLFHPIVSAKPTGLGVGLYIARHIIESEFEGNLELIPSKVGANFRITLPRRTINASQPQQRTLPLPRGPQVNVLPQPYPSVLQEQ